jgi:hypothetical protein
VVKNMTNNHEDWWYTEQVTLSSTEWNTYTIHIPSLLAFDWYTNSDTQCSLDGLVRICFCVSPAAPTMGSFWIDDVLLTGEITPAKDYAQTVILRREDRFATDPTDGVEVYRGQAETCVDNTANVAHTYYYAAFAADDRNNWSVVAASAQWKKEADVNTEVTFAPNTTRSQKLLHNNQLLILRGNHYYTLLGQRLK